MSKCSASVMLQCSGSESEIKTEQDSCTKDVTKANQSQFTANCRQTGEVRCSEILIKAGQLHQIQNGIPVAQTAVVHSCESYSTRISKTINVKPKTLLGQLPQNVAQTIKLASKTIPIPAKSRMILLNSPVLLNRNALVEASLNAVIQSQGTSTAGRTANQETPVFEVVQEPTQKTFDHGQSQSINSSPANLRLHQVHVLAPSKSQRVDSSHSKTQSINSSSANLKLHQVRFLAPSKSHKADLSPSNTCSINSIPGNLSQPNSELSPQLSSKSYSTNLPLPVDSSPSIPQLLDSSSAKSDSFGSSVSHSKLYNLLTSSSDSRSLNSKIDSVPSRPCSNDEIQFECQKPSLSLLPLEKDKRTSDDKRIQEKGKPKRNPTEDYDSLSTEDHFSEESRKEEKPPASTSTKQDTSIYLQNGMTTFKVKENDALILTSSLKTSTTSVIEKFLKHIPRLCVCRQSQRRAVMADQVLMYKKGVLQVRHLPNIRILLIHGQEMAGLVFKGLLHVSIAEVKQKLLAKKGKTFLDQYLEERSSELKSLDRELKLFLMKGNTCTALSEYMISIHCLRTFKNDMLMLGIPAQQRIWSNITNENFYVRKSGKMWCISCHGFIPEESSMDIYTDIELPSKQPECDSKTLEAQGQDNSYSSIVTIKNLTRPSALNAKYGLPRTEFEGGSVSLECDSDSLTGKKVYEKDTDIRVGCVKICRSAFTAYKMNDLCFVSIFQLLLKKVISLHCIERELKLLNAIPQPPPEVVENHFQKFNSIFVNSEWIDLNTLRCVCCMEKPHGESLDKDIINSIISGKIEERFEYTFLQVDNFDQTSGCINKRVTLMGARSQVSKDPGKDKITEKPYQCGRRKAQEGVWKIRNINIPSIPFLRAQRNVASEEKEMETRCDIQQEQTSEPIQTGRKRRRKTSKSAVKRKKISNKDIVNHPVEEEIDLPPPNVAECNVSGSGEDLETKDSSIPHLSSSGLEISQITIKDEPIDHPNVVIENIQEVLPSPTSPGFQSSQITIKNEPMDPEDELSAPEHPSVVIEQINKHENIQEVLPEGLLSSEVKSQCSQLEMECDTIIAENPSLDSVCKGMSLEHVDQLTREESDCNDCEEDTSQYKHEYFMLGVSFEANHTDISQNIKTEPSE